MTRSVLVVEDEPETATLLADSLRRRGFKVDAVYSGEACLEHLQTNKVDVVVTDVRMPGMDGIELCRQLRDRYTDLLPLVITGVGGIETVIQAIRAGAYDYISKPVKVDALEIAVGRAIEHLELQRELKRLRTVNAAIAIEGIAGESPAIKETVAMIRRVADSDATVLITGESGTGKELVARALHQMSPRRDQPFVAINCAAVPAPLLESELFGHVRGAFTDAKRSRPGLFAQAGAGTVFLDEIGEMPLEMQVKLLRVLQDRKVRPVGGDEEFSFAARVLTATNRDLEHEVAEKRFREDLFYRINVVEIGVPPLRARGNDVLVLAQFFLDQIAKRIKKPVQGISAPAARLLMTYDWPGNVRELENCMERAVALSRLDEITIDDLPDKLQQHEKQRVVISTASPSELITLDEMERRYVRQVLGAVAGNKTHAAKILGIDRRSLYRRLEPADKQGEQAEESQPVPVATEPPSGG
ncbi:MAG TPA: sigma-54 dependent transcriptional regulator [Kofleriaceae bacterium]|nr:sigma-54 dependent transcriptional regulator [Kofleriaceae bacterium]